MLKAIFSLSTISLLSFTINAQNTDSNLIFSNRIGLIESSRTVPKGGFMLEGGLVYIHDKYVGYQGEEYHDNFMTFPRLRLSYGVTNFMEASIEESFSRIQVTSNTGYSESFNFSRYRVGLKFNLTKQKGFLPQSALSLSERIVITNANTVHFSPSLNFAWNYTWGTRFNLSGDFSYAYNEMSKDEFAMGLRFGYDFKNRIGVYSEAYFVGRNLSTVLVSAGMTYQVSPRMVLSASVGTDVFLYDNTQILGNGIRANFGISFLLNNPNKKAGKKNKVKRLKE